MSPAEALALGALQGATEFLPISSSGHLRLAQAALDAHPPSILFDIALHVATLIAVVIVFRRDLWGLLVGLRPTGDGLWRDQPGVRSVTALVVASIPTAAIGLGLSPLVEDAFPVAWVGALLLVNGLVLLSTRGRTGGAETERSTAWGIGLGVAFAIGVAQGIAVLPGISRSGATIATALFCGVAWRPAATFSFLLSIPAILGALVLELRHADAFADQVGSVALGMVAALVVGVVCLHLLMWLLARARFHHFAWYCFALGLVALALGAAN